MTHPLSYLALLLVAATMGLALAHALEFPGKLRLSEAEYRIVQTIYYPGFTIGGLVAELGGIVVLVVLLVLLRGTDQFWWTAGALGFMLLLHIVYWVWTHPVNGFWLENTDLAGGSGLFFSIFSGGDGDWRTLRQVWEYSHVARAVLGTASLLTLSFAMTRPL